VRPALDPAHDAQTTPARRAKRALRERALTARDALAPDARGTLSERICTRALALPELAGAATVMLFASFRSEVDTAPLIRACLARGVAVALPRIAGPRLLETVTVADTARDLVPGTWDIPEPRAGLPPVDPRLIDLVFVPGAAFSAAGGRCGYGGGFYDALLPRLRPGTPLVGLAFEAQMVADVPCEPHDLTVDAVVTEARVIRCRAA